MIDTVFFWTKFRGGQNFLITVGGFYNEREYSGADWLVLLVLLERDNSLREFMKCKNNALNI